MARIKSGPDLAPAKLGPTEAYGALSDGRVEIAAQYLQFILDRHLANAPRRDQAFVDLLIRMLNPDCKDEAWRLVPKPRRAGTPAGKFRKEIMQHCIVRDADILYREYLAAGLPNRGLRKRVEGEVAVHYGFKDTTIALLLRKARRAQTCLPKRDRPVSNVLAKALKARRRRRAASTKR
jgi:hypothetical protein